MSGSGKRQYGSREPKKPKAEEKSNRMPTRGDLVEVKKWEKEGPAPLMPRFCPYRLKYANHYLIDCPACAGYPID